MESIAHVLNPEQAEPEQGVDAKVAALMERFPYPGPKRVYRPSDGPKQETITFPTCPNCNVSYPPWLEEEPGRCRCSRAYERGVEAIKDLDPHDRMGLNKIVNPDPSFMKPAMQAMAIARGERQRGLMLMGPPGRGKTHLMVGVLRRLIADRKLAVYQNVLSFVANVQNSYSRGEDGSVYDNRRTQVENLAVHGVVMLDDLGKERTSEDVAGILYETVDLLYVQRRTLIVATNLSEREMNRRYDEALLSRLAEMCETFEVGGPDRRRQAA